MFLLMKNEKESIFVISKEQWDIYFGTLQNILLKRYIFGLRCLKKLSHFGIIFFRPCNLVSNPKLEERN